MLVDRTIIENQLDKLVMGAVFNTEKRENLCNYAYLKYNMNKGVFADYILTRKSIAEASVFELFVICDAFDKINKISNIKKYFTDKEIENFTEAKFENNELQFPLVFKVIKIADDQWIGKISVDDLLKMKNAQIINYDPNTQRAMKRVVRGDNEMYKITIDKRAVEEIKESMVDGSFIPNAITLNIPEDEGDYSYDEDKCEFYIYSIDHLNINDGYHRYLAMSKAKDLNENFNMNMELRITTFDVLKSQRFIFQEDHKTRMSKAESDSYNSYAPENIITNKLNDDPMCNLRGLIGRNGDGLINFIDFSYLVKSFYYNKQYKVLAKDRKYMLEVKNHLSTHWNIITEILPEYLDRKIEYKELFVIFTVIQECENPRMYDRCIEYVKKDDIYNNIPLRIISKSLINRIKQLIKEVK